MLRGMKTIGAVAAVAVTGSAHALIPLSSQAERDARFVASPSVARAAAFGFDAVVADWHWLDAVQIVGAEIRGDPSMNGPLLARLLDVTTTLDPWVDHPYRFAAVWLTDSPETVRAANRLLERGIAHHPTDWRNRFHLAFNHFFHLQDEETAARVLDGAVGLPGAPRYLPRLAARLRSKSGGLDASALFLRELVKNAPDGFTKAEYEKALDEIETERRARVLDAARDEFRRRNGRDITSPGELAQGSNPVLKSLPPEPNGWEWTLDAEGRIVSSWYGHRYETQIHAVWRRQRAERAKQQAEAGK